MRSDAALRVPIYLTLPEAAAAAGLGVRDMRALIAAGRGPPVTTLHGVTSRRAGRRTLIRDDLLAVWAATRLSPGRRG